MQPTPPKAAASEASLPTDWLRRKVLLTYGDKARPEHMTCVPKGMFFAIPPNGTDAEWLVYVYDLDSRQERALLMRRLLVWRMVGYAPKWSGG